MYENYYLYDCQNPTKTPPNTTHTQGGNFLSLQKIFEFFFKFFFIIVKNWTTGYTNVDNSVNADLVESKCTVYELKYTV